MHRKSTDKTLIVYEAFAEDHDPLGRDFILANILGVIPASHLNYHQDLAKLAIDCLLYTSPSPRDGLLSRMPSSA